MFHRSFTTDRWKFTTVTNIRFIVIFLWIGVRGSWTGEVRDGETFLDSSSNPLTSRCVDCVLTWTLCDHYNEEDGDIPVNVIRTSFSRVLSSCSVLFVAFYVVFGGVLTLTDALPRGASSAVSTGTPPPIRFRYCLLDVGRRSRRRPGRTVGYHSGWGMRVGMMLG